MTYRVADRNAGVRAVPAGREPLPAAAPAPRTPAGRLLRLQRSAGNRAVSAMLSPGPATVGDVRQHLGPGLPLDRREREPAEAAAGADFGRVRVHRGAAADELCRAFGAGAFTLGTDIVVAGGGQGGLLAHELAHVVQQGGREAPPATPLEIGPAADPAEREAEDVAGLRADAIRVRRPVAVQRYLAGAYGHGGIEEPALQAAGLPPAEAKLAYYGNWLRDLSQIGDGKAVHELIRVLATGEFGRAPTDEEIGRYLASEHLDRPDKGGTAEDPLLSAAERARKTSELTGEQRRFVEEEQTPQFQQLIQQRVAASGLPQWIEVGKEHAKRELTEAVALGHGPAGLAALGNGLHAVEDYFSHSNFTEVALGKLVGDGRLAPGNPLVAAVKGYIGVDPAHVSDRPGLPATDRSGRPRIVTGTSVGFGANMVGLWETIKTEIVSGELRNAFIRGVAIRYGWQGAGGAGAAVLGKVGGVIGGLLGFIGGGLRWLGGTLGGLFAGAGAGAAAAWHGAPWWQKPFAALGGLFAGAGLGAMAGASVTAGPLAGAQAGWRTGERAGSAVGRGLFGGAGAAVTGASAASIALLGSTLLAAVDLTVGKAIIPAGTRASIKDAPYGSGPTHSQIAKDDPEHPLFRASSALASEADRAIGRAVLEAWNGTDPAGTRAAKVQALVDVYVAHPYAAGWWEPILLRAALAAGRRQRAG